MTEYKTRIGYTAVLNDYAFKWSEHSPSHLGIIKELGIAWAWYEDGRSIDSADDGFDLMDFHWDDKPTQADVAYYCTDFGRVRFAPGMTVATVKANEETIKKFARARWEAGDDDPYEWPDA